MALGFVAVVCACGGGGKAQPNPDQASPSATASAAAGTASADSAATATAPAATAGPSGETVRPSVTPPPAPAPPTVTPAAATPSPATPAAVLPTVAATATVTVPATPPPAGGGPVTLTVRAKDKAFDKQVLRARTGAQVTAVLVNDDAGEEHNLAISIRGLGHETCTGPCSTTVTFTAPEPGAYFYACTIHDGMFGTLFVE